MKSREWTVVWGWYGNPSMLNRESFESRKSAWERVQEIMSMRSEDVRRATGHAYVSVLEVYTSRNDGKPGHEISKFSVYEAGSELCKWGQWGVYRSKTTGEVFG